MFICLVKKFVFLNFLERITYLFWCYLQYHCSTYKSQTLQSGAVMNIQKQNRCREIVQRQKLLQLDNDECGKKVNRRCKGGRSEIGNAALGVWCHDTDKLWVWTAYTPATLVRVLRFCGTKPINCNGRLLWFQFDSFFMGMVFTLHVLNWGCVHVWTFRYKCVTFFDDSERFQVV